MTSYQAGTHHRKDGARWARRIVLAATFGAAAGGIAFAAWNASGRPPLTAPLGAGPRRRVPDATATPTPKAPEGSGTHRVAPHLTAHQAAPQAPRQVSGTPAATTRPPRSTQEERPMIASSDPSTTPATTPAATTVTSTSRSHRKRHLERPRWTRRVAAATTVAVGLAVSGVAVAAWTVSGAGEGSAAAAEAADLSSVSFSVSDELYPGFIAAGTLTVTNTNPFPVKITAITFQNPTSTDTDEADISASCTIAIGGTTTDVRFLNLTSQNFVLAASSGAIEITLADIVEMDDDASNDCQNATFGADVVLTAASTTDAVNTGD